MTRRLTWLALPCLALLTTPASAGVVVLKNGQVIVGKIRADEDTQEQLIVHFREDTGGDKDGRGEMVIPKWNVRWYSRELDRPNDEYWERFLDAELADDWVPERERYKLRQEALRGSKDGELLDATADSMAMVTSPQAPQATPSPVASEPPAPPAPPPAASPPASSNPFGCSLAAPRTGGAPLGPLALLALLLLGRRRQA